MNQNEYGQGDVQQDDIDLEMPLEFALRKPIRFGQDEIAVLTIRPFTAKDMAGIKRDFDPQSGKMTVDTDATIKLTAKLTNIPPGVLMQMTASDLFMLDMNVQTFLLSGQWATPSK